MKAQPVQGELFDRPPRRQVIVNIDEIERVVPTDNGRAVVVGKRGEREYHINISDEAVSRLLVKLKKRLANRAAVKL